MTFDELEKRYPELVGNCSWETPPGWGIVVEALLEAFYEPLKRARENLARAENALLSGYMAEFYTPEYMRKCRDEVIKEERRLPKVLQVKEKFGGLRVYTSSGTPEVHAQIRVAELLAARTCQECGSTEGVERIGGSWMRTVCPECSKQFLPVGDGDVGGVGELDPPTSENGM